MDDDFNTAAALGILFELVRQINQARDAGATNEHLKASQGLLLELGEVLGMQLPTSVKEERNSELAAFIELAEKFVAELKALKASDLANLIEAEAKTKSVSVVIDSLLKAREKLRAEKQWAISDRIRDLLSELGVQIEDSSGGSSWRWG
jgi:cysteinyl-tRNA synthetase